VDFINAQILKAQNLVNEAKATLAARSEGQAIVEYGLVLVLVGVAAVVGLTALSGQIYDPNTTIVVATSTVPAHASDGALNAAIFALSGGTRAA
jgi:Flp pilus assembly pilin Flp